MPPAGAHVEDSARVILISIDGLMPSSYLDEATAAQTPNLRALAASGLWADGVVGVLPTVTYPSHTTLITGVEPARHGIYDNQIFDPEGRSNGAWYWYADAIKVPTLPMAARARGLRAGAVTWPVTIGMDLDYLAPEYIGTKHEESLSMLRVLSRPRGLIEAAEIARGKRFAWPQNDRDRTDLSTFILKTYDPHVFLLHLIELDGAQHTYGPGSPEALATLARVDGHVGEIIAAVRAAGRAENTTIAVVSDHGFLPVHADAAAERRAQGGRAPHRQRTRCRHRVARLLPRERRIRVRVREGPGGSPAGGRTARRAEAEPRERHSRGLERRAACGTRLAS